MAERVQLTGIGSRAWEHPADKAALTSLKAVPGLDTVLKHLLGATSDKQLRMAYLASAVRVGETQFPGINKLVTEACRVLDVSERPDVYVAQTPFMNASVLGVDKPFIVLNSSTVDIMDESELLYIIGHELGHCLSGHALYFTLAEIMRRVLSYPLIYMRIPGAGLILLGVWFALLEWMRKAELSADRAGLLTLQEAEPIYTALMKFTGGKNIGEMDLNAFLLQAADYEATQDIMESFYKLLNTLTITHPFPVTRLPEIKSWYEGGAYEAIIGGEYSRKDSEKGKVFDDINKAREQYKEDLSGSKDPITNLAAELGKVADTIGQGAVDTFSSLFGTAKKKD